MDKAKLAHEEEGWIALLPFFQNGHLYQKIIQNLWMILRLQLTVAVYSWSIANNFVIDVY